MNLQARLDNIRKRAFNEIEEAARESRIAVVVKYSGILEEIARAEKKLSEMVATIDQLEKSTSEIVATTDQLQGSTTGALGGESGEMMLDTKSDNKAREELQLSARARAVDRRRDYVRNLRSRGIDLQKDGEKLFRKSDDSIVAMPYAFEREAYRWFLGQKKSEYKAVVLLCERDTGELIDLVLPGDFLSRYGQHLSEVKGEIKFNISEKRGAFWISVPGVGNINLNQYKSNYDPLRS
ncbi:MAG: hypothetical protein KAU50_12645 [Candidatus Marinimicrobia bacterium]|nr:hypothetical protein [Candidatus Neomarinimicrobiota bacterium]